MNFRFTILDLRFISSKLVKPLFLSMLFVFTFSFSAFAKTPEEQMKTGNEAYRLNHFKDACSEYESLVKEGYVSGELFYNLGNTYYRMNKSAKAILYYEKAKLLLPHDEALENNLKMANLSVTDKIETLPELAIVSFFKSIISFHTSSGWAWISIILLWLALAGAALYLFTKSLALRKTGFYSSIILLFICIVCFVFSRYRHEMEDQKFAIIFAEVSYIKTSPEENGKDAFYLHSGMKVEVKETLGDWINIRLSDGKTGWMKKDEVENI